MKHEVISTPSTENVLRMMFECKTFDEENQEKNVRRFLKFNPSRSVSGINSKNNIWDHIPNKPLDSTFNSLNTSFTYPHPPTTIQGSKNANITYDKLTSSNHIPDLIGLKTPKSAVFPFETFWNTI